MEQRAVYELVVERYAHFSRHSDYGTMRSDEAVAMAAQIAFDEACRYTDEAVAALEKRLRESPSR